MNKDTILYLPVSVEDELPIANKDVFAYHEKDKWQSQCFINNKKEWYNSWDNDTPATQCYPSHWLKPITYSEIKGNDVGSEEHDPNEMNTCIYCGGLIHWTVEFCDEHCKTAYKERYKDRDVTSTTEIASPVAGSGFGNTLEQFLQEYMPDKKLLRELAESVMADMSQLGINVEWEQMEDYAKNYSQNLADSVIDDMLNKVPSLGSGFGNTLELIAALLNGSILQQSFEIGETSSFWCERGSDGKKYFFVTGWGSAYGRPEHRIFDIINHPEKWSIELPAVKVSAPTTDATSNAAGNKNKCRSCGYPIAENNNYCGECLVENDFDYLESD